VTAAKPTTATLKAQRLVTRRAICSDPFPPVTLQPLEAEAEVCPWYGKIPLSLFALTPNACQTGVHFVASLGLSRGVNNLRLALF
jgi:hypothetical protein